MTEIGTPRLLRASFPLLALLYLLLLAAPAHGAWSTPSTISTPWPWERPLLARDDKGDAVLVWSHDEELETYNRSGLEASARTGDGAFSPAVVLSSTHQGGPAFPELAMDSAGTATLVWDRFPAGNGGPWVEALTHHVTNGWGPGVRVSPPGVEEAGDARLALTPNGDATLALRTSGERIRTLVERHNTHGSWRTLLTSRLEGLELTIAVDAHGETVLADSNEEGHRINTLILGADGRPEGPVQTFSSGRTEGVALHLVADRRGDAVLIWRDTGAKRRPLRAVTRKAGGRFTGPTTIAGATNTEANVGIDADGRATVIFTHTGHAETLDVTRHAATGRWTRPRALGDSEDFRESRLGVLPGGDLLLVGVRWPDGVIEAATLRPDDELEDRVPLSGAKRSEPTLAVAANGAATAAWLAPKAIETADYTP